MQKISSILEKVPYFTCNLTFLFAARSRGAGLTLPIEVAPGQFMLDLPAAGDDGTADEEREGFLVEPARLRRHDYLSLHHSQWSQENIDTEQANILAKVRRYTTQHESSAYKQLLMELVRCYTLIIAHCNRLNSQPCELEERARGVILDSEVKIDELRAVIKSSCLILERGTDAKAILPGPSSCDYNSEDRSRVRESELWIKRKEAGGKQRGPRRSRRGFVPYGRGGGIFNSRQQYAVGAGSNSAPQYGPAPQQPGPPGGQGQTPPLICYYCGKAGHRRSQCLKRQFDGR